MTRVPLGSALASVELRLRDHAHVARATLIGSLVVPVGLCLLSLGRSEYGRSTPLPSYELTVQDSHCDHAAELVDGTLRLRTSAMLVVTLRPASFVQGQVTLRSFVEYPQLPPVRLPLSGEQTPSQAGTFRLRTNLADQSSLRQGHSRILFVISRPWSLLPTRSSTRQVLALPIEVLPD